MSRTLEDMEAERIADDIEMASWDEVAFKAITVEAIEDALGKAKEDAKEVDEDDEDDPTVDDLEADYQEALNVLADVRVLLEDLAEPAYNWRLPDAARKNIKTTLEEVETYLDSVDEGEETES